MASETSSTTGSWSESDSQRDLDVEITDAVAAEPEPEPEPAPRTPKTPRKGVYTLEVGDSPSTVSVRFYGRSHMAAPLVRANPDSHWEPGDTISLV